MHAHQNLNGIQHSLHGKLVNMCSQAIIQFWNVFNNIENMVWIMGWEYNGLPVWRFPNSLVCLHGMF